MTTRPDHYTDSTTPYPPGTRVRRVAPGELYAGEGPRAEMSGIENPRGFTASSRREPAAAGLEFGPARVARGPMIYMDTSALVKLIARESESADLRRWLAGAADRDHVTSAVGRV